MTTRSQTQRIRDYQRRHPGMSYMQARRELEAPVDLEVGTTDHPLTWQPPGLIGIIGEPGSGKTTHLNLIGERLAGRDVIRASGDGSVRQAIGQALGSPRNHETFVLIDNLPERMADHPDDTEAIQMIARMSRSTQTYLVYTALRPDVVHPIVMAFTTTLVACAGDGVIQPQHDEQRIVAIGSARSTG